MPNTPLAAIRAIWPVAVILLDILRHHTRYLVPPLACSHLCSRSPNPLKGKMKVHNKWSTVHLNVHVHVPCRAVEHSPAHAHAMSRASANKVNFPCICRSRYKSKGIGPFWSIAEQCGAFARATAGWDARLAGASRVPCAKHPPTPTCFIQREVFAAQF
jgi:hypothetical protein